MSTAEVQLHPKLPSQPTKTGVSKRKGVNPAPPLVPESSKPRHDPAAVSALRVDGQGNEKPFEDVPTEEGPFVDDENLPSDDDYLPSDEEEEQRRMDLDALNEAPPVPPETILQYYNLPEVCEAFQKIWVSPNDKNAVDTVTSVNNQIEDYNKKQERGKEKEKIPITDIISDMDVAKDLTRKYLTNKLTRIHENDPNSMLCCDALQEHLKIVTAKCMMKGIPIEKYLHPEASKILEDNASVHADWINATVDSFKSRGERPSSSPTVDKGYQYVTQLLPSVYEEPDTDKRNDVFKALEKANKEMVRRKVPKDQLIPVKELQAVITNCFADTSRMPIEMACLGRTLAERNFPIQWMPKTFQQHSIFDTAMPEQAAEASAPPPDTATHEPPVEEGIQRQTASPLNAGQFVSVPDETNGLTVYGKFCQAIRFGSGMRVFVNYGTERDPVYDVFPGSKFQVKARFLWKGQIVKPDFREWSIAGVHDIVYANGDHTYYLVARGQPYTGDRIFMSKTQVLKIVDKPTLEYMETQILGAWEERRKRFEHCQQNNLHPDTNQPLTEQEELQMPWLAKKNYMEGRHGIMAEAAPAAPLAKPTPAAPLAKPTPAAPLAKPTPSVDSILADPELVATLLQRLQTQSTQTATARAGLPGGSNQVVAPPTPDL